MRERNVPSDTVTAAGIGMMPAGTCLAGRYDIREIAGAGGMGVVYRAFDRQLEIDVALKVMRTAVQPDAESLKRFRNEILLARQVSHPNVVRIHDLGRDGDVVFLTMDFVPGRTLKAVLEEGPLPVERALEIAADLAGALAAAHREGVVHRDLKPGNILIDEGGRARIMDFGVAWSRDIEGVTLAGEIVGTPAYLAPEQVRGGPVDGRADIYALGLVLCEMLSGTLPVTDGTRDELLAQRAAGSITDPGRLVPEPPAWLAGVLRRCLAADPEDRYPDAESLQADLAGGQATQARRKRRFRASVALLGGVLVAAGLFALWQMRPPPAPAEDGVLHIAVLPVVNATGRETVDWAERGLAESLALALAENPKLQVTDPLRVFRLLEDLRLDPALMREPALRRIGELLEIERMISGRMTLDAAGLRYEFAVLDARAAELERVSATATDFAPLEMTVRLAGDLQTALATVPVTSAVSAHSESDAALSAYDTGLALLARGESVAALEPLQTAVSEDPAFGAAWLRLAEAREAAGHRGSALDAAEQAAARLAGDDDRLSLYARARLASLSGNPAEAATLLEQLLSGYPNDTEARTWLAEIRGDMGEFEAARNHLDTVTAADPQHPRAWYLLGKFAIIAGDARRAADDYLVRALVIENRVGSDQGRGDVLNALGIAHDRLGEYAQAEDYYRQAVELREAAGDRRGMSASMANLAHLAMLRGDFDEARDTLRHAVAVRAEIGDDAGMADLENQLGALAEERGDFAAALAHYREALRLREALGLERAAAESYNNVAFAHLMLGQYDNAMVFNRNALEFYEGGGDAAGRLMALEIRGQALEARGDWDVATESFLSALALARELDNPFSEAIAQAGIGLVAYRQGRFTAAREAFEATLSQMEGYPDTRGMVVYGLRLAELAMAGRAYDDAAARLETVESMLEHAGALQLADYHRLAGLLAAHTGGAQLAEHFDRAQAAAEQSGNEPAQLRVKLARAEAGLEEDVSAAAERAARLGDAVLHASGLLLHAERQLTHGQPEAALETVRSALRSPVHLPDWAENWRLHRLAWLAAEQQAPDSGAASLAQAREGLSALLEAMPPAWRAGYTEGLETALTD